MTLHFTHVISCGFVLLINRVVFHLYTNIYTIGGTPMAYNDIFNIHSLRGRETPTI